MSHQELKEYHKRAELYLVLGPDNVGKEICINDFISKNPKFICIRLIELIEESEENIDIFTNYSRIPDFIAFPLIRDRIFEILNENPYAKIILDGFPRYLGELKDLLKAFSDIVKNIYYFTISTDAYMQRAMEKWNSGCVLGSEHLECEHCNNRKTEAKDAAYNMIYKNWLRHKFYWEFMNTYYLNTNSIHHISLIKINAEVDIPMLITYFNKNMLDDSLNPKKAL